MGVKVENGRIVSITNMDFNKGLVIPEGVTHIKSLTFKQFSIKGPLVLPSTLEYIGQRAFEGCDLGDLNIPSGLTRITDRAFSGSGITSLVISDTIKEIGEAAFSFNKLKSLVIPDTVQKVETKAFAHNSSLSYADIHSVEILKGRGIFASCPLEGVRLAGVPKVAVYSGYRVYLLEDKKLVSLGTLDDAIVDRGIKTVLQRSVDKVFETPVEELLALNNSVLADEAIKKSMGLLVQARLKGLT